MPRSRSRSPRSSRRDYSDRDIDNRSSHKSSRSSNRDRSPYAHRSRSRTPAEYEDEYGRSRRRDDRRRRSDSEEDRRDQKRSKKDKKKHKKSKKERYHESEEEDEDDDQRDPTSTRPKLDELGYTNVNNPFNDVNLESKFQWAKKKEKDRKAGLNAEEMRKRERDRRRETEEELAKLNKRRAEREIEMELREEEKARMQRDAELAQMGDWKAKEDEFHLEQAKKRAEIRIREGRAKPIDILAMNMRLANEADKVEEGIDLEVDLDEPYTIFDDLTLAETEELHRDIQMYLTLEKNEESLEFWRAMLLVSADILEKMVQDSEQRALGGVSDSVKSDIEALLSNKSLDQLTALQTQVTKKLQSNEPIDVEYWENLLKELIIYKAKAKLRDMHQVLLTKRLEQLRLRQRLEAQKVQEELEKVLAMHGQVRGRGVESGEGIEADPVDEELTEEQDKRFEEISKQEIEATVSGYERDMSPVLFTKLSNEDKELEIIDPEEDIKRLLEARRKVMSSKVIAAKSKPKSIAKQDERSTEMLSSIAADALFDQEASKGIDEDEEMFNIETELAKEAYLWQDKYRPRKPRYFNRVHTGYEWNKYNQTHYDQDNPPPKVVQGYKFNIFYPDLIDKSSAPTYFIEKDPGTNETVTIRFHAGPPYEDVAFRIVNREWEYSHKKGFRSAFDRGILSLHFHFKREFYRK
ncbi:mid region of cactin-domain-containing protein [Umbelopsis sp. PMI_123]|nr:mid region of cactin-domain-containing protein [Umbelopsis sp. PMI_123]